MIIRIETTEDCRSVYNVHVAAFGGQPYEAELVERIRKTPQFVQELSLVMEVEGELIAHMLLSEAEVSNGSDRHNVLALAPLAVRPEWQRKGVGEKMITNGLSIAKELGYSLVFVLGHPAYYPKFGFVPARKHGIELNQFDAPDEAFMVYELIPGVLAQVNGELLYPEAFKS